MVQPDSFIKCYPVTRTGGFSQAAFRQLQWKTSKPQKAKRAQALKAEARAPGISIRLNMHEAKVIRDAIKDSGLNQTNWTRKALLYVVANDIRLS